MKVKVYYKGYEVILLGGVYVGNQKIRWDYGIIYGHKEIITLQIEKSI